MLTGLLLRELLTGRFISNCKRNNITDKKCQSRRMNKPPMQGRGQNAPVRPRPNSSGHRVGTREGTAKCLSRGNHESIKTKYHSILKPRGESNTKSSSRAIACSRPGHSVDGNGTWKKKRHENEALRISKHTSHSQVTEDVAWLLSPPELPKRLSASHVMAVHDCGIHRLPKAA